MRALKHIAGILLAAIGVLFVLALLTLVFDPDPEVPLWGVGVMFVFLALLPLQRELMQECERIVSLEEHAN